MSFGQLRNVGAHIALNLLDLILGQSEEKAAVAQLGGRSLKAKESSRGAREMMSGISCCKDLNLLRSMVISNRVQGVGSCSSAALS